MRQAIDALLSVRHSSIAFLKSGWIPAIKELEPFAEQIGGSGPRSPGIAKQIGQAKGGGKAAHEGWVCKAVIWNAADARHDHRDALILYGAPALQAAFDVERSKMQEYIERKQRQAAHQAGIKTN